MYDIYHAIAYSDFWRTPIGEAIYVASVIGFFVWTISILYRLIVHRRIMIWKKVLWFLVLCIFPPVTFLLWELYYWIEKAIKGEPSKRAIKREERREQKVLEEIERRRQEKKARKQAFDEAIREEVGDNEIEQGFAKIGRNF